MGYNPAVAEQAAPAPSLAHYLRYLTQNLSDLVAYVLIPAVSVLVPARMSRSIIARCSRWSWLMSKQCQEVFAKADGHRKILYPDDWKSRWRQVELLDARDLFLLTFGRQATVFGEFDELERLDVSRDKVLVGMHWGPSISILRLLKDRQLAPTLVYRNVEPSLLKVRPFLFLFLKLAVREITRSCEGRAIAVQGALSKLRDQLKRPGTPIVVVDAPPTDGRSVIEATVMDRRALFHTGFPRVLIDSGRDFVLFAISLDENGRLTKKLEIRGPFKAESEAEFLDRFCEFLTTFLETDTAQWRIWHVADQFFQVDG